MAKNGNGDNVIRVEFDQSDLTDDVTDAINKIIADYRERGKPISLAELLGTLDIVAINIVDSVRGSK